MPCACGVLSWFHVMALRGFVRRRNLAALVVTLPLLVAGLAEGVAEPLQTFVETVTGSGAGGLDVLF